MKISNTNVKEKQKNSIKATKIVIKNKMNTKIRVKTQKVNDKISDKKKHIMKIPHINLNIYDKTPTSQQHSD